MNKRFKIYLAVLFTLCLLLFVFYKIDRKYYMKERVLGYYCLEYDEGYHKGDFTYPQSYTFKGDTVILPRDTFILKYEYFGRMKVGYPNSNKTTTYEVKGGSKFWGVLRIFTFE